MLTDSRKLKRTFELATSLLGKPFDEILIRNTLLKIDSDLNLVFCDDDVSVPYLGLSFAVALETVQMVSFHLRTPSVGPVFNAYPGNFPARVTSCDDQHTVRRKMGSCLVSSRKIPDTKQDVYSVPPLNIRFSFEERTGAMTLVSASLIRSFR